MTVPWFLSEAAERQAAKQKYKKVLEKFMFKQVRHIIVYPADDFQRRSCCCTNSHAGYGFVGMNRTYSVNDPSVPSSYTWKIDGVTQSSTRNLSM